MEESSSRTDLANLAVPAALLGMALLAVALPPRLRGPARGWLAGLDPGLRPGHLLPSLAALAAATIFLALAAWLWLGRGDRRPLRPGALGAARRARARDLRGLRARRGGGQHPTVRLGTHRWSAIVLPEEEHLLALGPTGSGKSSGIAIPAILEWPGPVVVTDPKGELLRATLGARRERGRTAVFAPLMLPSDRWNPVGSIRSSEDALRTAGFLMGKAPDREPFWHDLALQLLQGLLIEAAARGAALGPTLTVLQGVPAEELPEVVSHPVARQLVQGALSGGDRTAMGVVATLVSRLGPFGTEQIAEATSESSFDPAAIASGGLTTLYCLVTPPDAPLLRGLVSSLLACCWRAIYATPPALPVLFVLDEFAQLTCLPELPALVQLGRSQGVRMVLLAQDLASISATYGGDVTAALWANCRTKLLLPGISEIELLERASKLAGTATLHAGTARSGEPTSAHPLMAPDEIRRLSPDRALVIHGGDQPAVIRQRRWYSDPRLRRAANAPPGQVPHVAPGRPLGSCRPGPARVISVASPLPWEGAPDGVGLASFEAAP